MTRDNDADDHDAIPMWVAGAPLVGLALLGASLIGLASPQSTLVLVIAAGVLGWCVFAAVHLAETIALRVGEPFGSIVLAIAVTIIEVALIVSIMLSAKAGSEVLARDTVFATFMIVVNGVVGLCLLVGGLRYHEQSFRTDAAAAAMSVLGTLAVISLVLPNYTLAVPGPYYSNSQLIFVAIASVALYVIFLFVQTIRHRHYFLVEASEGDVEAAHAVPSNRTAMLSLLLLCLALTAVVLLAKTLAPPIERLVIGAGLPTAFVGVIIAAVVLLPEGLSALNAARHNRLQTSLNLALGSAIATIGLTIPIVSIVALLLGQRLSLGLDPEETVLLVLTLFITTVTLAIGRTTILQGAVHMVIFAVFMYLAAVP